MVGSPGGVGMAAEGDPGAEPLRAAIRIASSTTFVRIRASPGPRSYDGHAAPVLRVWPRGQHVQRDRGRPSVGGIDGAQQRQSVWRNGDSRWASNSYARPSPRADLDEGVRLKDPAVVRAPVAAAQRPTEVTVASLILIMLGGLAIVIGAGLMVLWTLAAATVVPSPQNEPGTDAAVASGYAMLGTIPLLFGIGEIVAGIGALRGRDWGRMLGLLLGGLAFALSLLFTIGAAGNMGGGVAALALPLIFLALYGVVVWALGTRWSGVMPAPPRARDEGQPRD